MLDLKIFNSALDQLEEERGIPREKIIEAIELALASAYKKDYGKKGQIVRAHFDGDSGKVEFEQVKIAVDESIVRMPEEDGEEADASELPRDSGSSDEAPAESEEDMRARFNPEHHILLSDARKIKKDAELEEEIVFPLEVQDEYGRIAAQTAKQVIIQKIREAEKLSILAEFEQRQGEVLSGIVQRVERGSAFIDLGRTIGILPPEEQIRGEHYRQGARIKVYLLEASEGARGVNVRLSRSHPEFLKRLFEIETPEIANGIVEVKSVAREAGARSKIAVSTTDQKVDPIGAMVGQRGIRVSTVMNELGGEKIDIVEWSDDPEQYVSSALSPAKITDIEINEEEGRARVIVAEDQLSLAIGKGGQNVRLAAKLTGWRIDIEGTQGETIAQTDGEEVEIEKETLPEADKEPERAKTAKSLADDITADEAPTQAEKNEAQAEANTQAETTDTQNVTPENAEGSAASVEETNK